MEHAPRSVIFILTLGFAFLPSGPHAETSVGITPKDKSGHAKDHVGAGRRTGWGLQTPGVLPLSIQHDHAAQ